jgi:hypothetical protein
MSLSPGNYGLLRNARQYLAQRLGPRGGMIVINPAAFDQLNIHSIRRLNDKILGVFPRIYGAGTKLYIGEGTAAAAVGFSGNPLSLMPYRPDQSPEAWMYVGDSSKMVKVRSDGLVHTVGFAPPLGAPVVEFGPDVFLAISNFGAVGSWTNGGTAGSLSEVARVNTTITAIVYDMGTLGFACVAPASIVGFGVGQLVTINTGGGTAEQVLVSEVRTGIGAATIGSIIYDTGATGLCTIQPNQSTVTGSNRGLGAIQVGPVGPARRIPRATSKGIPHTNFQPAVPRGLPTPSLPANEFRRRIPSARPLGIQPDAMVLINSGGGNQEYVRVLSVSVGPNNSASFRCSTVNTHVAGEPLIGVSAFRAYLANTHAAAETLKDGSIASAIGAGTGTISLVSPFNLTTAPPNAIQETDNISISIFMDHPEYLTEAKIFFDVDPTTNNFTQNYFYAALRQADTQQAVSSNQTALAAKQQAITKGLSNDFGWGSGGSVLLKDGPTAIYGGTDELGNVRTGGSSTFSPGGTVATSKQAATGGSQWTQFTFKVSDLVRVGSNLAQTLANVAAIRIQIQATALQNVQIGDLWIGGTYGPDIGATGSPYFYRDTAFSSLTGVESLAGPPTRSGIEPKNQQVAVFPQPYPNANADKRRIYRWGGTLPQWTYVGVCPNDDSPEFLDDLSDTDIAVNPGLEVDQFQPFPTVDLPRSGICNTVGTKVIRVSGDVFNMQWYPGSQININGIFYSLYSQPLANGTLEIVENAGTQSGVPFFLTQPTILGVPLPSFWGPYAEGSASFFFACGDFYQPGTLFLTNGNNPDGASDTLQIECTSPSEPLINGCMFGTTPFVWSSGRLFLLQPNLGSTVTSPTLLDPNAAQLFIPDPVPGSKGLFAPWAFSVGTMIHYLSGDGIYQSNGSGSDSITEEDLYLLFPHDGQPAQAVTVGTITINPPNMSLSSKLRLAEIDGFVYFDFVDINGTQRTLVYNIITKVWAVDDYTPTVGVHYQDEGQGVHAMILGGTNGIAYISGGPTDGTGFPFPCEMRMPQLSELPGGYEVPIDAFLGLQSSQNGNISLVVNVDGADNLITVPVTTNYERLYQRLSAVKGKILAFGLAAPFGFTLFQRDCQVRCGNWGRADAAPPTNPFSDLRRAQSSKIQ